MRERGREGGRGERERERLVYVCIRVICVTYGHSLFHILLQGSEWNASNLPELKELG